MNIDVNGVTFSYPSGVVALRGVNLAVAAGQSVAIVGQNGAGKTTLAKHLNGLLKPETGSVHIGDWETREHSVAELAGRIGYVFQNPDDQLFASTVGEEVAFGPRNLGFEDGRVQALVTGALDQVGLLDQAALHPYDLPMPQRKLVALAAVLAMDTPIVLFDEPTTGQDAAGVARIGAIVEALKAESRTVLTISHDIDFCADHFGRVVVMRQGEVLADGPAAEIFARADLLAQSDVAPPQLVRLAAALGLPGAPHDVASFVAALSAHRGTER